MCQRSGSFPYGFLEKAQQTVFVRGIHGKHGFFYTDGKNSVQCVTSVYEKPRFSLLESTLSYCLAVYKRGQSNSARMLVPK